MMSEVATRADQSSTTRICDTDTCLERVGDIAADLADHICADT